MINNIFTKGTDYKPSKRQKYTRDEMVYEFLNTNDTITRDDFNNLGIKSVDFKVNIINRGGRFKLIPYKNNDNGWYIRKG
jgi:hypothetical protein